MGFDEKTAAERAHGSMARVPAADLLHGVVGVAEQDGRWVRPLRFSEEQLRALGSCQAWHPGLYRQMARTTSGVTVEFETDAREVALELRVDAEPRATRSVLELLDQPAGMAPQPHDGVSADVDGRHLWCGMPEVGTSLVRIELAGSDPEDALGLQPLPGMGRTRLVRIWLPALRGCEVRDLLHDGSFVRPVPQRGCLLALGDSITQGFVSEDPAHAWPALFASRLKLDLVNQGLAGQVFQPDTLYGLAGLLKVERIVVAYGANYRQEPCGAQLVSREIRSYLAELARLWPKVPVQVISPLWHDEQAAPTHPRSCYAQIPDFISTAAAAHEQMSFVDGLELVEHETALLADGAVHPNERAHRKIATRLNAVMRIPGLRPSSVGRRRPKKTARKAAPQPPEDDAPRLPLA